MNSIETLSVTLVLLAIPALPILSAPLAVTDKEFDSIWGCVDSRYSVVY